MAVVIWQLALDGRSTSQTATELTASLRYLVTTNDKTDDENDILNDANAPNIGAAYAPNPLLSVSSVSVQQDPEGPLKWQVTVQYSTSVPEDKDEIFDDPRDRPPEVSVNQIKSTEPIHVVEDFFSRTANTNIALENSAGVPYDPALEREVTDVSVVVMQNLPDFRPNDILGFRGAVNNEKWETFDEGQARIANIAYRKATENGITYWQRTIEIHIRAKTADYSWDTIYPWQILVPNMGYQQLTTGLDKLENCVDANGEPVSEPAKLSLTGRQIDQDQDTTFTRRDLYPQKNFADLDIRLT